MPKGIRKKWQDTWKEEDLPPIGICVQCGNEFPMRHPGKKYCSSSCRQTAYEGRKLAGIMQTLDDMRRKVMALQTTKPRRSTTPPTVPPSSAP